MSGYSVDKRPEQFPLDQRQATSPRFDSNKTTTGFDQLPQAAKSLRFEVMKNKVGRYRFPLGFRKSSKEIPCEPRNIKRLGFLLKIEPGDFSQACQLLGKIPTPGAQLDDPPIVTLTHDPSLVSHEEVDQTKIPATPNRRRIISGKGVQ